MKRIIALLVAVAAISACGDRSPLATADAKAPLASGGAETESLGRRGCLDLPVGTTAALQGEEAADFCLGGEGREYVMVATNTAAADTLRLAVTGAGAASPTAQTGPRRRDREAPTESGYERRLRAREMRELGPLLARSRYARHAQGARTDVAASADVPAPGDRLVLNANLATGCASPLARTGIVKAVGEHALVVADSANPANGLTDADYASLAAQFDTLVWPTDVPVFGAPSDVDGNGRVIVFYTRLVNELTPAGSGQVTIGLFMARDLFPRVDTDGVAGCAASNAAEMFYMMVPDPAGTINGNVRTADWVKRYTLAIQAHEFQHLINAGNRLYRYGATGFEEPWLNEGLSHIAEELLFMKAAGLERLENLSAADLIASTPRVKSAFNQYEAQNYIRFDEYLKANESHGPAQNSYDLATRGATWSFLRYAADRRGGRQARLWHALANTTLTGRANLQAALEIHDLGGWMSDWAVSVFADDYVDGLRRRFDAPSWNARSIMPFVDDAGFALVPHPVRDGETVPAVLANTASAYLGTASGAEGVRLAVRSDRPALPRTLVVQVLRTR